MLNLWALCLSRVFVKDLMQKVLDAKAKAAENQDFSIEGRLAEYEKESELLKQICEEQLVRYNKFTTQLKKEILAKLGFGYSVSKYKKIIQEFLDNREEIYNTCKQTLLDFKWLTEKFGTDGEYTDAPGLCKIASIAEVEEKIWSLTPGAYVGVAAAEDDGVDFAERMHEIHAELLALHQQSNELMEKISANFKELGI